MPRTPREVQREPDSVAFNSTEADNATKQDDYNYEELKREYELEMQDPVNLNQTFNYTDIREKESVKDALETVVDFNTPPKNCTGEESKGIGIATTTLRSIHNFLSGTLSRFIKM